MSDLTMLIVGALAALWLRRRKQEADAVARWREDVPINGTDFQGAIWDRLNGTDLLTARWEGRNLADSTVADPGRIGQAQLGLQPDWMGNLS